MPDTAAKFYSVRLAQERDREGEKWVASHPDLLGCIAVGHTPQEALDELAEALPEWIDRAREMGAIVPEPSLDFRYNLILHDDHCASDEHEAGQALLAYSNGDTVETFFVRAA